MFLGVAAVSHRRTVRSLAALVLALGVGVTGCTEDAATPTPMARPTATVSSSVPPTPTPTLPPLPPEARGATAESAKAFVRYYVDTINYAMHTGETDSLRRSSGEDCAVCSGLIWDINAAYNKGGRFEAGSWRVRSALVQGAVRKERTFLTVAIRIEAGTEFRSSAAVARRTRATLGNLDCVLEWKRNRWVTHSLAATS